MKKITPVLLSTILILTIFLPTMAFAAETTSSTQQNTTTDKGPTKQYSTKLPENCHTVQIEKFDPNQYNLIGDFGVYRAWQSKDDPTFIFHELVAENIVPLIPPPYNAIATAALPVIQSLKSIFGGDMVSLRKNESVACKKNVNAQFYFRVGPVDGSTELNENSISNMINDLRESINERISDSTESLVRKLYEKHLGIKLPENEELFTHKLNPNEELKDGEFYSTLVPIDEIQPGDFLFFEISVNEKGEEPDTKVGIYTGKDTFIDVTEGEEIDEVNLTEYVTDKNVKLTGAKRYYQKEERSR